MLRVGIIGLGAISNEHVLGYLGSSDAEIVAVCEPDENRASQWMSRWNLPGVTWYRSDDEMLAKESLDIVEILTPHHLHHPQALKSAGSGVRAISIQKPMAISLRECDEIIEACDKNGVILRLYENFVFYPVYLRAKELIEQGLIGDLTSIRVNTMAGIRDGAEWPWIWNPGAWRMDLGRSGVGPVVGDDGHHKFSLARWFMKRDVEKIGAWIDPDTPLDAPAFIRAKFRRLPGDSPKYAQIDFSFSSRMSIPSDFWLDDFVEIVGDKGIMWINQCQAGGNRELFKGNDMSKSPAFPPIAVFVDGKVSTFLDDISPEGRSWSTSFVGCTRDLINIINHGGVPISTGNEGKEIVRYAMAAYLSAQENRDVYLDEITTEAEERGDFALTTNFCNL